MIFQRKCAFTYKYICFPLNNELWVYVELTTEYNQVTPFYRNAQSPKLVNIHETTKFLILEWI